MYISTQLCKATFETPCVSDAFPTLCHDFMVFSALFLIQQSDVDPHVFCYCDMAHSQDIGEDGPQMGRWLTVC
jgi:hypothetical protein